MSIIKIRELPPAAQPPVRPTLFAAVAICIEDGVIASIEQAAQFGALFYEDGWLMATLSGEATDYLVFAQSDVPAKIEQFKDAGSFELIFSDANGDPINPNRIDLQILKVR